MLCISMGDYVADFVGHKDAKDTCALLLKVKKEEQMQSLCALANRCQERRKETKVWNQPSCDAST